MRRASAGNSLPTSSLFVSSSSSIREYSICAMAKGSLPSMSGVLAGVCGVFRGLGSSAPRFTRDAEGTRFTAAEPQLGQASSLRCFWEAKSSAEPNQPSNRWPTMQSRSKTIIWHILQCLMIADRIEGKWIELFAEVFARCKVAAQEPCAVLSESQSRALNVQLAELALHKLGARPFHVLVPTPRQSAPVPIRSTGASTALQGVGPVVGALAASTFVADCTVEGLMHAPELPQILKGGARVLYISDEHPDVLERLAPSPADEQKVRAGMRLLKNAKRVHVTSPAGTELEISVEGATVGGVWGYTEKPGTLSHWPGSLCLAFPTARSVNGALVLAPGDLNLTFKRYVESAIRLRIENDYVTAIEGAGLDAELMREYFAAWGDREAYAVSHLGWGTNPRARWEALALYDRRDVNGTEQRAFAGNFLYSTGANEVAGRHTLGHFDLPLRRCTVALDGVVVVREGKLLE